jgi:hypothetical protein
LLFPIVHSRLKSKFRLRDMLDHHKRPSSENAAVEFFDGIGADYSLAVSYLYYHGAITVARNSNQRQQVNKQVDSFAGEELYRFTIPNMTIRREFLNSLQDYFKHTIPEVCDFLLNPDEKNLKLLLNSLLQIGVIYWARENSGDVPDFHSNKVGEDKLRDIISYSLNEPIILPFLKELYVDGKIQTLQNNEIDKSTTADSKRTDITINALCVSRWILLELKRIRPNYIIDKAVSSLPEDDFTKAIEEMPMADFLNLKLDPDPFWLSGSKKKPNNIQELVVDAIDQNKEQVDRFCNNNLSFNKTFATVQGFVCVQAGKVLKIVQLSKLRTGGNVE